VLSVCRYAPSSDSRAGHRTEQHAALRHLNHSMTHDGVRRARRCRCREADATAAHQFNRDRAAAPSCPTIGAQARR
jgi:hypothetical protein